MYVYRDLYTYIYAKKVHACAIKSNTVSRAICGLVTVLEALPNSEGKKVEVIYFISSPLPPYLAQ